MSVRRVARGRRATPGVASGVSSQAATMVKHAWEQAATCDNKLFGEMYATALERKVYQNDSSLFDFMKRLKHPPVTIEEFLESQEFLGSTDIVLWPEVRRAIIEINRDWWKGRKCNSAHIEAILMGSTSSGKSEISKITLLYHLYLLSCIDTPQTLYGLPKTTSIVFAIMAAKPHVTKKVLYAPLRSMVETIPYFQKHLRPNKFVESEMIFDDQNIRVVPGGSDADSILGEAIIGGIIDEINFMNVVLKSKKAEVSTGRAGMFDQAQVVHGTMMRRKKGRFIYQGPQIGIICTSSSTRYKGDFTDKRKAQVLRHSEGNVYIYDKPQYEVWPQDRYCGERFRLLVGNDIVSDTRILQGDETVPEGSLVLNIPIEYLSDFQRDPHSSLRDVCGLSTSSISPFFKRRFKIYEAVTMGEEDNLESFLEKDNVILGIDDMPRVKFGHYCANPSRPRYVHIDLSMTMDRCGISMIRFDGLVDVERSNGVIEKLPMATVELACSIQPDANSEIQFAEVRTWVKQLRDMYGYPIKAVTYDGTFSTESIQQWRKQGMKTGHVSVDRTSVPYKQLRDTFNDGRLKMFQQDVLISELLELEYDETKDKVDHPVNGCFTGDTRVALLDGTNPTFEELGGRYGDGRPFAVYSMSPEGITVGWARNPRITRTEASLVEVTLDNYQVIRCTPDHLFMTVDQEWVRAENLTTDVSIMPLYRSRAYKGGWAEYERVWCPVRDQRLLTHHMVASATQGVIGGEDHVHHRNEDKGNNAPSNLVIMSRKGHLAQHTRKRHKKDAEYVANLREGHRKYREQGGNERSRQNMLRLFEEGKLKRGRDVCSIEGCNNVSNAKGLCGVHYQRMRRVAQKQQRTGRQQNHRVLSVRTLAYTADVWDITVDKYHNFALTTGVFVHNSKDVADAVCGAYYSMLQRRAAWIQLANEDKQAEAMGRAEYDERAEFGVRL